MSEVRTVFILTIKDNEFHIITDNNNKVQSVVALPTYLSLYNTLISPYLPASSYIERQMQMFEEMIVDEVRLENAEELAL